MNDANRPESPFSLSPPPSDKWGEEPGWCGPGSAPHARHGSTRLTLHIDRTSYLLRGIASQDRTVTRCFELRKDGATAYHVSQHPHGCECTCPDFTFNRNHLDPKGCKHIRALVTHGLIANDPGPRRGA